MHGKHTQKKDTCTTQISVSSKQSIKQVQIKQKPSVDSLLTHSTADLSNTIVRVSNADSEDDDELKDY